MAAILHPRIPAQHTAPVEIQLAAVGLAPIAVHEKIVGNIVVILHRHPPHSNTYGPDRLFARYCNIPGVPTQLLPVNDRRDRALSMKEWGWHVPMLAGRPAMVEDKAPNRTGRHQGKMGCGRWADGNTREESPLEPTQALDRFLAGVERRAFVMARFTTGNADDAHDIVQEAMLTLVCRYASRREQEWGPLFHTILQSRIIDWHRRNKVRNRLRVWFGGKDEHDDADPWQNMVDNRSPDPPAQLRDKRAMAALESAIHRLPARQQQAFLLRVWEGLDVAQTAQAMKCSEGSVKTHYSRAVHALREQLEDHW